MKISYEDFKSAMAKLDKDSQKVDMNIELNDRHGSLDITYINSSGNTVTIRLFNCSEVKMFAKVFEESRLEKARS